MDAKTIFELKLTQLQNVKYFGVSCKIAILKGVKNSFKSWIDCLKCPSFIGEFIIWMNPTCALMIHM